MSTNCLATVVYIVVTLEFFEGFLNFVPLAPDWSFYHLTTSLYYFCLASLLLRGAVKSRPNCILIYLIINTLVMVVNVFIFSFNVFTGGIVDDQFILVNLVMVALQTTVQFCIFLYYKNVKNEQPYKKISHFDVEQA